MLPKRQSYVSCHNYWKAIQQQVYRELSKLETQGAIASEIVSQENRPDKKLYRLTPVGKEILTKRAELSVLGFARAGMDSEHGLTE